MKEIDARGLSCPAPVLQTRAVLQEDAPNAVSVLVDNPAAQQNVQRFLESEDFETSLTQNGDDYVIVGNRKSGSGEQIRLSIEHPSQEAGKTMIMCTTDRMGYGDDVLGLKLMVNFLRTLKEMGDELWRLVFVNNGVKLTTEGSEVIEDLQAYEAAGLKILVCGTCLDHFNLLERKQVGETTNMLDIVTAMQLADKVIDL